MNKTLTLGAALCAGLALAACGGGGGGAYQDPQPMLPMAQEPTEVPASAIVSPATYVAFTGSLATSETKDPLALLKAMPPTSETDEPLPLR